MPFEHLLRTMTSKTTKTTKISVCTWDDIAQILFLSIKHNGTALDMQDLDLAIPLADGDTLVFFLNEIIKYDAFPDFDMFFSVEFEGNKITVTTHLEYKEQNFRLFDVINQLVTSDIFSCGKHPISKGVFPFVMIDNRWNSETIPQSLSHLSFGSR